MHKPITQLPVDVIAKHIKALHAQGRHQEVLDIWLQIVRAHPESAAVWGNVASNYLMLGQWPDAIHYAQIALERDKESTVKPYAILSHAYGMLKQWSEARRYGLQALNMRADQFNTEPTIALENLKPIPPSPSPQTREHNIISFSLFGHSAKYCETAVLNVQEQPSVYPHWVSRFYVDGSVPEPVIARLRAGGAQIVSVTGAPAQWPGPMWRLLALDDPQAQRILFRDADAVISPREAHAVAQWLVSDKRFHIMRDWCSHTDLILAGMWGVVAGSLPPLDKLMERFMRVPLESEHFADQDFLRQYVWPYARTSLMQHDSVFGFMDSVPFPDGARPPGFHVGCMESVSFTVPSRLPDGSEVTWELYRIIEKLPNGRTRANRVCAYPGTVKDGALKAYIPMRYQQWIEQGTAGIRLIPGR